MEPRNTTFALRSRATDKPTPSEWQEIKLLRDRSRLLVQETLLGPKWKRTWEAGQVATPTNKIRLEYKQPRAIVWSDDHQMCLMAYTVAENGVSFTLDKRMCDDLKEFAEEPDYRVHQTVKYSKNLEMFTPEDEQFYWQFLHVEVGNDPQKVVQAMWVQKGYKAGDVTKMDLTKGPST